MGIEYLHTMVRVKDLEKSIAFYELLGLVERRRSDNERGRFTLVFMAPPDQQDGRADLELTVGHRIFFVLLFSVNIM